MPNNDDPIQSYGENKISKLFQGNELKGKRESKYEYSGEDSIIEEYNETHSYNNNNYNNNYYTNNSTSGYKPDANIKVVRSSIISMVMTVMVGVFFMILALTMNTINEKNTSNSSSKTSVNMNAEQQDETGKQYEEKYNKYNFSRLTSLSFDNGVTIPTLYKYESTRKTVNYQKYTYSDKRFGEYGITTVEIIYNEEITQNDKETYMKVLEGKNYVPVEINDAGEYIIVKDNLTRNVFTIVILGKNRVVYGLGNGRISDFLK